MEIYFTRLSTAVLFYKWEIGMIKLPVKKFQIECSRSILLTYYSFKNDVDKYLLTQKHAHTVLLDERCNL